MGSGTDLSPQIIDNYQSINFKKNETFMTFGDQIYSQTKTIRKRHEFTTYVEENAHVNKWGQVHLILNKWGQVHLILNKWGQVLTYPHK